MRAQYTDDDGVSEIVFCTTLMAAAMLAKTAGRAGDCEGGHTVVHGSNIGGRGLLDAGPGIFTGGPHLGAA